MFRGIAKGFVGFEDVIEAKRWVTSLPGWS
jgi:hypothetical protein